MYSASQSSSETPQQIKNEMEKEIEKKCLEKYRKSFDYFLGKINFNDSFLDAKAISEWNSGFFLNECIDEIIKSILTEYDKAIKEIIGFYKRTWEEDKDAMFNEGYMEDLFENILSKIGDNSEVEK